MKPENKVAWMAFAGVIETSILTLVGVSLCYSGPQWLVSLPSIPRELTVRFGVRPNWARLGTQLAVLSREDLSRT